MSKSTTKEIFTKCGVCGKDVKESSHIGIRLNDTDWDETWQWYHPKCYGSKFNQIPRSTHLLNKPESLKLCPIHKNRQLYDSGYCRDCNGYPEQQTNVTKGTPT